MAEPQSVPEEMPAPSAELVLMRVLFESFLASADMPKGRRALTSIRIASEILASEESLALVFPIRPQSADAATSVARRQALAWFRQMAPVFLARVPPRDI